MPQQQQEQRQSFNEAAYAERVALSCGIMALEEEILCSQGGQKMHWLTVNRAAVKLKRKEDDHLLLFSVSSFIETYRGGNTEQHSAPDDVRSPLPTQKSCQHSTGVSVQMYKVAHMFSFWVPNGYKNTEEVAKEEEEEKKQISKTEQQMWKIE